MLKNSWRSFMNPVWSWEIIVGRTVSRRVAKTFASILLTFSRLIGLYEPGSRGSLSFLWINDILDKKLEAGIL